MKIKKNGKVINLTESDLKRIVKKVLTEQIDDEQDRKDFAKQEATSSTIASFKKNFVELLSEYKSDGRNISSKKVALESDYEKLGLDKSRDRVKLIIVKGDTRISDSLGNYTTLGSLLVDIEDDAVSEIFYTAKEDEIFFEGKPDGGVYLNRMVIHKVS